MRRLLLLVVTLLSCTDTRSTSHSQCEIEVRFSPNGGIAQAMIDDIKGAKSEIRMQAVAFTSVPIAVALVEAKREGKSVEVVLDPENLGNKSSVINALYDAQIPVYIDKAHNIAHNKILIIDRKTVFTGSYNFSKAAEMSNAENTITLNECRNVADLYLENWTVHREHSHSYSPNK